MSETYQTRVAAALAALRQGGMVLLQDDEGRENEADMIFAAESADVEKTGFLIRHGSGIVCLSLGAEQARRLGLTLLRRSEDNGSHYGTPFAQPIGARHGITTGISAADRAQTMRVAVAPESIGADLVCPGHVFPLIAKPHGVLQRPGHTEGALDLVRLAGLRSGAALCEVMNDDGTVKKGEQIQAFAVEHGLPLLSIDDIVRYRLDSEKLLREVARSDIRLEFTGVWQMTVLESIVNGETVSVLHRENQRATPLVRVHSACFTGETLGSLHCDCRQQLQDALTRIAHEGGYLVYLEQEGRGIGLANKIRAYDLQRRLGLDTFAANRRLDLPEDGRDYTCAAQALRYYGVTQVRLLTANFDKVETLRHYGIAVEQVALPEVEHRHNRAYLNAKAARWRQGDDVTHIDKLAPQETEDGTWNAVVS